MAGSNQLRTVISKDQNDIRKGSPPKIQTQPLPDHQRTGLLSSSSAMKSLLGLGDGSRRSATPPPSSTRTSSGLSSQPMSPATGKSDSSLSVASTAAMSESERDMTRSTDSFLTESKDVLTPTRSTSSSNASSIPGEPAQQPMAHFRKRTPPKLDKQKTNPPSSQDSSPGLGITVKEEEKEYSVSIAIIKDKDLADTEDLESYLVWLKAVSEQIDKQLVLLSPFDNSNLLAKTSDSIAAIQLEIGLTGFSMDENIRGLREIHRINQMMKNFVKEGVAQLQARGFSAADVKKTIHFDIKKFLEKYIIPQGALLEKDSESISSAFQEDENSRFRISASAASRESQSSQHHSRQSSVMPLGGRPSDVPPFSIPSTPTLDKGTDTEVKDDDSSKPALPKVVTKQARPSARQQEQTSRDQSFSNAHHLVVKPLTPRSIVSKSTRHKQKGNQGLADDEDSNVTGIIVKAAKQKLAAAAAAEASQSFFIRPNIFLGYFRKRDNETLIKRQNIIRAYLNYFHGASQENNYLLRRPCNRNYSQQVNPLSVTLTTAGRLENAIRALHDYLLAYTKQQCCVLKVDAEVKQEEVSNYSMVGYVRHGKQLAYLNNPRQEWIEIETDKKTLQKFDEKLSPIHRQKRLPDDTLDFISTLLGKKYHQNEWYAFSGNLLDQSIALAVKMENELKDIIRKFKDSRRHYKFLLSDKLTASLKQQHELLNSESANEEKMKATSLTRKERTRLEAEAKTIAKDKAELAQRHLALKAEIQMMETTKTPLNILEEEFIKLCQHYFSLIRDLTTVKRGFFDREDLTEKSKDIKNPKKSATAKHKLGVIGGFVAMLQKVTAMAHAETPTTSALTAPTAPLSSQSLATTQASAVSTPSTPLRP